MNAETTDLVGAKPDDPPGWRLLFLLVQGRDGQWCRGFLLMALAGMLLVGMLITLLVFVGWAGGVLSAGWLAALAVFLRRRTRRSGRR